MKNNLLFLLSFLLSFSAFSQAVFINEINYTGSDAEQGVEIAGPSGTDLSGYDLYLYDHTGNNYHTENLNGTIPGATYDAIWFPIAEFADGPNNGNGSLFLEDPSNGALQFIGYGTLVAAINGPVSGQTPNAIGVVQLLPTNNIQLIGTGTTYTNFVWSNVNPSTTGAVNTSQSFGALPVELTDFAAFQKEEATELVWKTVSEINNQGFVIERSKNGIDFEAIGYKRGNGTTYLLQSYQFVDRDLLEGITYYRLKQIDIDGSYEYSETISIEKTGNRGVIWIYPNPLGKNKVIQLQGFSMEEEVQIRIFNTLGQLIRTEIFRGETELSLNELKKGSYYYQIETQEGRIKNGTLVIIE